MRAVSRTGNDVSRPLLLDLYCGAGGAAMGYHRAGFDVKGYDLNPQPHYPFKFVQTDAMAELRGMLRYGTGNVVAIHASPPCQFYSAMSNCRPGLAAEYPDLVEPTRDLLQQIGLPWVMENVEGSGLASQPTLDGELDGITLCGHMFGLKLYRHRLFESNMQLTEPPHPKHIVPGGRAGHWKPGEIISVSGNCAPIALSRQAMGIDWMPRAGLAESIPPAYTEHIGSQLMAQIKADAA
jgi:DNA (cytosine-5)-methyltransferase 1